MVGSHQKNRLGRNAGLYAGEEAERTAVNRFGRGHARRGDAAAYECLPSEIAGTSRWLIRWRLALPALAMIIAALRMAAATRPTIVKNVGAFRGDLAQRTGRHSLNRIASSLAMRTERSYAVFEQRTRLAARSQDTSTDRYMKKPP
jgi:hypothetical protein